jgi:outer membrane lipoprotein-sorting protein
MIISRQLDRHPWTRWAVPVAVAAVAVGGTALVTQTTADAAVQLPPRSAAQLLVDVQSASKTTGSGTVVQKAELGLPQLPTSGGSGSSDLSSLISGNHTLRIWYNGGTKTRVALLGTLGESDIIRNGRDVWIWASDTNTATHRRLPAGTENQTPKDAAAGLADVNTLTPQQVADKALAAIDPTTTVRTDGTAKVAGRAAYELVLSPKDTSSLIGQVRIAVDGEKYVPLRVQVFAKNATTAAVEVGFTQISFTTPSEAQFRFTPPPGAKVTEETEPNSDAAKETAKDAADQVAPTVSGTGWTSVIQAQLPADAQNNLGELTGIMNALPQRSGSWGSGRLLHANLFNVLLTDNGRLLAGPVTPERLYELAGQPIPTAPAAK